MHNINPKLRSFFGVKYRIKHLKGNLCQTQAPRMATLFDGISQQLDFTSCGEEGSSSDNSSDDYTSRIRSPRVRSPSSACRTPRVQRHRSRSNTVSSPLQCTSPIPYASWRKLRLCDSPSTPKVGNNSDLLRLTDRPLPWSGMICQNECQMSNQFNFSWINCISVSFPPVEPTIEVVPALLQH